MSCFDARFDYFDARAEHEENELRIADEAAEFAAMSFEAQEAFLESERLAFRAAERVRLARRAPVTMRVALTANGVRVSVGKVA